MTSAEVLLPEDQAEFERVLDDALRTVRLTGGAEGEAVDQLRALALRAMPQIAAAAEPEYRHLTRLRRELRSPRRPGRGRRGGRLSGGGADGDADGVRDGGGDGGEAVAAVDGPSPAGVLPPVADEPAAGSGVVAMVAVLAPVLSVTAAVIFLLFGHALALADPEPAIARPMRDIGWVFLALAAVCVLLAFVGLLVAAIRNEARTSIRASRAAAGRGDLAQELARAREDWRRALLDHGIMPFLREQTDAAAGGDGGRRERRTPRLTFSSPEFASPDFDSHVPHQGRRFTRPRFSQPEFSGPRFGKPAFTSPDEGRDAEERTEAGARRGFAAPEYSQPEFSSPDFASPGRRGPGAEAPGFASPDFEGPDFASPDFEGPDFESPDVDGFEGSTAGGRDAAGAAAEAGDDAEAPADRRRGHRGPDRPGREFPTRADGGADRD